MRIFSEISTWIFVPIILALIGGKALDKAYGTKPLMLLVLAGVAFLISAYGIVKAVRNFTKNNTTGNTRRSCSRDYTFCRADFTLWEFYYY